jgi:hypothetical protein
VFFVQCFRGFCRSDNFSSFLHAYFAKEFGFNDVIRDMTNQLLKFYETIMRVAMPIAPLT